ncbi:MAG: 3-deoxy-7-phosphoheptulonate synthase [Opitutales bacterium]
MKKITDINITSKTQLPTPVELCNKIKRSSDVEQFVVETRNAINKIIFGDDPRLLVVVGPCSIHDLESGRDYAKRLAKLSEELSDRLLIVMRVYFEKPRTTVGWKGLIMDPKLDGTSDIPLGLEMARSFLTEVLELGLPTATELLDPITPQYIADLICWSAVGARTTESQTHRQMASGLSMPLGFKNATNGDLKVAINAIQAASQPQTFLGIDNAGQANALTTKGNPNCHIVLRGGSDGPNYSAAHVKDAQEKIAKENLEPAIMIDCSHANSNKNHELQASVFHDVVDQSISNKQIIGTMLESNIHSGKQAFPQEKENLQYGVSITDACIDWETTEKLLKDAYNKLEPLF